ncbi:MAG TPA: response regulator transcription factor [Chloroflexi bacterium]|nr:response regulator transcription factor [Chloroflexota bacterium]
MTNNNLHVLIVEDEIHTQSGIRDYLTRQGMTVNTVANAADALRLTVEWQPDVIVMDIVIPAQQGEEADMHQGDGIRAARQIKANNPGIGIVFFSSHPYFRPEILGLAGQGYGGLVYLLKGASPPDRLKEAIEQAHQGQLVFDSQVGRGNAQKPSETSLSLSEQEREKVEYAQSQMSQLTDRELEIVEQAAASRTAAGIAKELGIAPGSVQSAMRQIYSKVGLAESEGVTLLSKRALLSKAYIIYRSRNVPRQK